MERGIFKDWQMRERTWSSESWEVVGEEGGGERKKLWSSEERRVKKGSSSGSWKAKVEEGVESVSSPNSQSKSYSGWSISDCSSFPLFFSSLSAMFFFRYFNLFVPWSLSILVFSLDGSFDFWFFYK